MIEQPAETFPCGICTHLMKSITKFSYACERCNRYVSWEPANRPDPTLAALLQRQWELHLDELEDEVDQA